MNKIKGYKIRLRRSEILRSLKHMDGKTASNAVIEDTIQEQIENAYSLIDPAVVYKTYSATSADYTMNRDMMILDSKQIKDMLRRSAAFTVMAVTIGPQLEEEVSRLKEKDLAGAYVLDAAGSEAVEQAVNFVSKLINEEAQKQDCVLKNRFSPGYGDWPLQASRRMMELIDFSRIKLTLTPDNILIPRKSVTALQAWKTK